MAHNAMMRYEALLLAVPEITADESSALESQIHDLVSKSKGETVSFDRWGKFHLAYPVRKNEYGVYYLSRFDVPAADLKKFLDDLRQLLAVKYSDVLMRHMVTSIDRNASLDYKRPESLEETPRREAGDSFGKKGGRPGRRDNRRPMEHARVTESTESEDFDGGIETLQDEEN